MLPYVRQYCRTVVIEDMEGRFVAVATAETGMVGYELKLQIIERLRDRIGNIFDTSNLLLTSTHTHSAPGGYLTAFMFAFSVKGIHWDAFDRIVVGCATALETAFNKRQAAGIFMTRGLIENVQMNRSPTSYMANPADERLNYDSDTNKEAFSLIFKESNSSQNALGSFTWFGLHPTSLNYTNRMVSSDNRGYAAWKLERDLGPNYIAAIPQESEGDVSPNTAGPICPDGSPCDARTSTCTVGKCIAYGPGEDMFDSVKIIGDTISSTLKSNFINAKPLNGTIVRSINKYVDFSNSRFSDLSNETTCSAAFGCSFAAGTIDGNPLDLNEWPFYQGDTECVGKPIRLLGTLLQQPSKLVIDCHHPKPILLDSGEMNIPWNWSPSVLELQIIQIGSVLILALPFEITTMASRRLRKNIKKESDRLQIPFTHIIVSPLSNDYADYLTTFEEYQEQRYEAASTIFGPNSLTAVEYHFKKLLNGLIHDKSDEINSSRPADNRNKHYSVIPDVIYDIPFPRGVDGAIKHDVLSQYFVGETVIVEFYGANPRNAQTEPFMVIEQMTSNGQNWTVFDDDSSWYTKVHWKR